MAPAEQAEAIGAWAHMNSSQVFSRVWASFDAGEPMIVCAWCGRVRLDGDWFRPSPAAVPAIDARFAFSHSICGGCAEAYLPPADSCADRQE